MKCHKAQGNALFIGMEKRTYTNRYCQLDILVASQGETKYDQNKQESIIDAKQVFC
jgi:hypothetical protein